MIDARHHHQGCQRTGPLSFVCVRADRGANIVIIGKSEPGFNDGYEFGQCQA